MIERIILDQSRFILSTVQERQERLCKSDIAQVVGDELCLNLSEINRVGLAEIHSSLNARIEDDAIQIGMVFGNAEEEEVEERSAKTLGTCMDRWVPRCKFGDFVQLGDIKGSNDRLILAMLMNEFGQPVLSAARNNDSRACLNASSCKSFPDSTGRSNDKHFFIRPRHDFLFRKKTIYRVRISR